MLSILKCPKLLFVFPSMCRYECAPHCSFKTSLFQVVTYDDIIVEYGESAFNSDFSFCLL